MKTAKPKEQRLKYIYRIGKYLLSAMAMLIICAPEAAKGGPSVTISPASDKIIAVNGTVDFSCTATGGCPPYTYAWSYQNSSGSPSYTESSARTVTFGSDAAGQSNYVSVTVTDANGDTDFDDMNVWVPKFEAFDSDVWYFQDGYGENYWADETLYPISIYATVVGLPTGKTAKWLIKGQNNIIKFDTNNQQQITNTNLDQLISSVGWSTSEENLWIELECDGHNVATSDTFTARAPTKITVSANTLDYMMGWETQFTYTIKDKFNQLMPGVSWCEVFTSPADWPKDYPDCDWNSPNYGNDFFDPDSTIIDSMLYATNNKTPTSVTPSNPKASVTTMHNTQKIRVGGYGSNAGYDATGFEAYTTGVQFCRGKAYHY